MELTNNFLALIKLTTTSTTTSLTTSLTTTTPSSLVIIVKFVLLVNVLYSSLRFTQVYENKTNEHTFFTISNTFLFTCILK